MVSRSWVSFSSTCGLLDLQFAVFPEGLVVRIEDQQAVVAVEQHVLAALERLADVVQADHGGDVHRARHDGRVRGAAADVRGETEDQVRG